MFTIQPAAEWTAFGCFWTNGQICSATSRLIVQVSMESEINHSPPKKKKMKQKKSSCKKKKEGTDWGFWRVLSPSLLSYNKSFNLKQLYTCDEHLSLKTF